MTPVAAALDGQNGFGFVVGMRAMNEAIAMAREYGIGIVAARRSTHFGMAACYALPAVEAGLMAMVFSNASQAMPPWGGRRCCSAPIHSAWRRRRASIGRSILDMSPAVAARGKIRRAERRGETIPLGYALDAQGRPTTDPKAALAGGVVLPIGEHKGSGLSMFMDIFGGVISGANFGGDVGDQYNAFDRPQDVGHFFLAMKPDLFVAEAEYRARIDTLIERIKALRLPMASPRFWCLASLKTGSRPNGAAAVFPMPRAKSPPCRRKPSGPQSSRLCYRIGRFES